MRHSKKCFSLPQLCSATKVAPPLLLTHPLPPSAREEERGESPAMMRCFGYRLNMTSSEQNGEFQTYLFGIPRLLFATHSTNTRNDDRKTINKFQSWIICRNYCFLSFLSSLEVLLLSLSFFVCGCCDVCVCDVCCVEG